MFSLYMESKIVKLEVELEWWQAEGEKKIGRTASTFQL